MMVSVQVAVIFAPFGVTVPVQLPFDTQPFWYCAV
jgi:hypothetical protein